MGGYDTVGEGVVHITELLNQNYTHQEKLVEKQLEEQETNLTLDKSWIHCYGCESIWPTSQLQIKREENNGGRRVERGKYGGINFTPLWHPLIPVELNPQIWYNNENRLMEPLGGKQHSQTNGHFCTSTYAWLFLTHFDLCLNRDKHQQNQLISSSSQDFRPSEYLHYCYLM